MDNKPILIDLDVGKPKRRPHKLSAAKRKLFLQYYSESGNMTAAAAKVGMTRQAIRQLILRDDKFKAAWDFVEDAITDKLEAISLSQASLPREGFQDRRLQLQARRPDKYNPHKLDHQTNIQVNITNPTQDVDAVLNAIPVTGDK